MPKKAVTKKSNIAIASIDANSDATMQLFSYLRDFSNQATQFRSHKTEESLVLLNRSVSLLSTTIQPQYFNPAQLEVSQFFLDLHGVMGALATDADALWACVGVLQHCCRNLDARLALVTEYRFVPLLSFILKRTQAQEKMQRLLLLLQELTYGIRINWLEPYVIVLLEQLVKIIKNCSEDYEETQVVTALSTLINLCYKNFVVLLEFLRSVNISDFSRKIQNHGMLANKMLIMLSEDMHTPGEKDVHIFLRSTFAAVNGCIQHWDVPQLRHIVDFLMDSKSHSVLHHAMLSYGNYCEDIEHMLDQLEARFNMDDSSEDTTKHQQLCMGLIFKMVRYVLELSCKPLANGDRNATSLDSNVPRIFELLCNWSVSQTCGVEAVNLMEALVRLSKKESISPRIARDPSILIQLIGLTENTETRPQHTTAILELLIALLHEPKTEKLVLSKITESYFDKVFAPLLGVKPEQSAIKMIALEEIEKSIFCLLLLINFAGIAKKAYFDKCCTLLQSQSIQCALARAMLSGREAVCAAVFQISQFEHFPQAEVAKHISQLSATPAHLAQASHQDDWRTINAILKSHRTFISKEIEERLHALIESISDAQRQNQLNNVPTSQMIELFNYKIDKLNTAESRMQKRLEDASNEITNLTQRINLQNAELQKHLTMNLERHINQENLQAQCQDLKQQKDNLKRSVSDLMKKLAEQAESLQISDKRLSVKISELIVLQNDYKSLKNEFEVKSEELEKLQITSKENAQRIDKLKHSIATYEVDMKEKQRLIDEKERDLVKTQRALDEQKEAKKKSDGIITVLEAQLQEKNEQIRSYEMELNETEELRKTILSLMESKKSKRKP